MKMSNLPPRLQEMVDEFRELQKEEKVEYLLDLSENLPPLPNWLRGQEQNMDQVHECMTPVFVFAEEKNGRFSFHFGIPPESPTVRGYAALLQRGLENTTSEEILSVPGEFYLQMGLQGILTNQRLNGLGAILAHVKTLVQTK
jgi:cysteine desulfuration protein SufE